MQKTKKKAWYKSKSFWGSLLFAIALWSYTSLNSEYQTIVEIPLKITLPSNRALENVPPENVFVDVKGSGWNLFYLIFLNNAKICNIDLSREVLLDSIYRINKIDLQRSLKYLKNVSPINVLPENIQLITGKIEEYEVLVDPQITIIPRDGFMLIGKPIIDPLKVKIRGNDKIVSKINKWETENILFDNINSPILASVNLIDTLKGVVSVTPKKVLIKAEVQQSAEITIDDIAVDIVNGSLPAGHIIEPPIISVVIQGGVGILSEITKFDISAVIEFDKIINDTTGIIKPVINLPSNVSLLRIDPPFLTHKVISNK
ncbi:MAG: hypothetical protein N3A67_08900 [Ignavibacteria bacterium]|nr:hypothetical protein [Ignavibacteria bacterium]